MDPRPLGALWPAALGACPIIEESELIEARLKLSPGHVLDLCFPRIESPGVFLSRLVSQFGPGHGGGKWSTRMRHWERSTTGTAGRRWRGSGTRSALSCSEKLSIYRVCQCCRGRCRQPRREVNSGSSTPRRSAGARCRMVTGHCWPVDNALCARNIPLADTVGLGMRAMTYSKYGTNDVLELTEQPLPKVGPGEVRIRVTHASINPVDWKVMSGGLNGLMDAHFPVIPGWDVAGVVDEVGPDVPEFTTGDRVAAYARKQVVSGGTFAEYVTVFAVDVAAVPDGVGNETAAALPLAGLTALRSLEALDVRSGERLLLHAASGGVGFLAAQLAVAMGAEVVGTASEANHAKLAALGVTPVAYGEGLGERLHEVAPDGFDKVADFVGGVMETTLSVLKDEGSHVSIADPSAIEHGGRWLWVRPDGPRLSELLTLTATGALEIAIDRTFGLEELPAAFAASQDGTARGKLVLHISD